MKVRFIAKKRQPFYKYKCIWLGVKGVRNHQRLLNMSMYNIMNSLVNANT